MKSLRYRLSVLYASSLAALLMALAVATYIHLNHELREEVIERTHPDHPNWVLHADFAASEVNDILGELFELWVIIGFPLLVMSAGIGWLLARKSVRPFEILNDQLGRIGPNSLSSRLTTKEPDPHLHQMVERINAVLERVEAGYNRLDDYATTVAHELRTPVMAMRLQLEGAGGNVDPALADSLQEELASLSGYIERSLLSARAENGHLDTQITTVEISVFLRDLIEPHAMMAREEGREMRLESSGSFHVRTDKALLRQVIDNLLVNALQHGTGDIQLRVIPRADKLALLVVNSCGGSPARRGNGIGLRLVHAIASALPDTRFLRHAGTRWHAAMLVLPAA